jgi:hypothetical protein
MKPLLTYLTIICCLLGFEGKGQTGRVGIGTTNPIAKLSIDSGLNIDQANVNGVGLESALTFGNNKKVGIGSRRTTGTNQAGLDFYTQGIRRMVIDSFGNVGIGTTAPDRRLHVEGTIYGGSYIISSYGIASGIGNVLPSYDVHAGVGYFTTRLGIGTFPTSTYALDVDNGPVRIRQDARIDGVLNPNNALTIGNNTTVDGNLTVTGSVSGNLTVSGDVKVNANKGIVRSNNSTQVKIVRTSITLSGSLSAGGAVDSGEFGYEAFGGTPQVYVGNMISASNSGWAKLVFVPFEVDSNSCKFRVFNHSEGAVSVEATYALLIIGPE